MVYQAVAGTNHLANFAMNKSKENEKEVPQISHQSTQTETVPSADVTSVSSTSQSANSQSFSTGNSNLGNTVNASSDPVDSMTPLQARQELGKLAVQYDIKDFIIASKNNDMHVMKLFLKAGMDPNVSIYVNLTNISPLSNAVRNGNIESVKLLLEHGADPNLSYSMYDSILTLGLGDLAIAKELLEYGADPNFKHEVNHEFVTPLYRAVRQKDAKLVELLMKYGADPNLQVQTQEINLDTYDTNVTIMSPLELAKKQGDPEILNLLTQ